MNNEVLEYFAMLEVSKIIPNLSLMQYEKLKALVCMEKNESYKEAKMVESNYGVGYQDGYRDANKESWNEAKAEASKREYYDDMHR